MKFFLFLLSFSYIHCDCLEFSTNQTLNECHIQSSFNPNLDIHHYYSECLQCRIQSTIHLKHIRFEEPNPCWSIQLQCIHIVFDNDSIFEFFFHFYQHFLYDLFNQNNGTDQNTLHITIKKSSIEEINNTYIDNTFQYNYQAYRALFFELYIQNQTIQINSNLLNITRFSIKLILICENGIQTIYTIHNHNLTLESEQELCSSIFISSIIPITSTSSIALSSHEVLSISHEKSKHIARIIILATSCLLCILVSCIICFVKHRRHRYPRSSRITITTSEPSTSHEISVETPLSLNETPKLNSKLERSSSRMRAIQLLEDDL